MKYEEFVAWCNKRACDGCWDPNIATHCIDIMNEVNSAPFWKRKKVWNTYKDFAINGIVNVINKKKGKNIFIPEDNVGKREKMKTCNDCIHKSVCYRTDSISSSYADKCGDFKNEFDTYSDYCIAFDAINQADTIIEAECPLKKEIKEADKESEDV